MSAIVSGTAIDLTSPAALGHKVAARARSKMKGTFRRPFMSIANHDGSRKPQGKWYSCTKLALELSVLVAVVRLLSREVESSA